jgi:hypothetical protein
MYNAFGAGLGAAMVRFNIRRLTIEIEDGDPQSSILDHRLLRDHVGWWFIFNPP